MTEELYRVRLEEIFEGPMDLLVHLIKKNELDIYDIPIALITEQYLQYLEWMQAMNLDFAGDFIVMASTLTQLKSRMLLPVGSDEDEDEDIMQEITRPLLEYKTIKCQPSKIFSYSFQDSMSARESSPRMKKISCSFPRRS